MRALVGRETVAMSSGEWDGRGRVMGVIVGMVAVLIAGCIPPKSLEPMPAPLLREQALQIYNANVRAVPAFAASISDWQVKLKDDGKIHNHTGNGRRIFYRPPGRAADRADFYLVARAVFEDAFVIGSNQAEYWLASEVGKFAMWGLHANIGKDCVEQVVLDPELFLEFVGLQTVPTDGDGSTYVMYHVTDEDNIIQYAVMTDEGMRLYRQIVVDRRTNLPRGVTGYDSAGLEFMRSELKNYKPVKPLDDVMLPADILLSWPGAESFIHLKIGWYKVDTEPKEKLFMRPRRFSGVEPEDYRQVDKACDD